MSWRHSPIFFSFLFVFSSGAAERRDLSAGVVFPSTNSAVVENPGSMNAVGSDKSMVDLTAYTDNDFSVTGGHGAYAKAKDYYAYGLVLTQDNISGAFGVKIQSNFHVGLGLTYDWGDHRYWVPVGIWTALADGLKLGWMVSALPEFTSGAVGIAGSFGGGSVVELDMLYSRVSPTYSMNQGFIQARPSFVFTAAKKFSFKAAYEFSIFPEFDLNRGYSEFGISYWVAKTLALYVGYQDTWSGTYQIGIRSSSE